MEQALTEMKAHLMATSEEFRQLAAQHAEYQVLRDDGTLDVWERFSGW